MEPTHIEHPLEPVFDARSRVLVLGTMPSPKSREAGFYLSLIHIFGQFRHDDSFRGS